MKIYLTLFLLLFVDLKIDSKRLSPKEERILIEKSFDKIEKQILELNKVVDSKEKLKK